MKYICNAEEIHSIVGLQPIIVYFHYSESDCLNPGRTVTDDYGRIFLIGAMNLVKGESSHLYQVTLVPLSQPPVIKSYEEIMMEERS